MINNLELIKPLLKFESKDDFYYLQILKRKKDQSAEENALGRNNNARTIKNYYIGSIAYLEEKMPEIIKLCEVFNARASLRLNKRSFKKIAFNNLKKVAETMGNGDYHKLMGTYSKTCGVTHNAGNNKTWIVDIDEEDLKHVEGIVDSIEKIEPLKYQKEVLRLPTKTGIHIITRPFNLAEFKKWYPNLEIHKDNPVNLYIP